MIRSIYNIYVMKHLNDLPQDMQFMTSTGSYPTEEEIETFLEEAPDDYNYLSVERCYTKV